MVIETNLFNRTYKTLLWIVFALISVYLSYTFFDIIVMFTFSLLIAMVFNPLVTKIEARGVSRFLAVLLVFIAIIFVLILGFSVLIPKITYQFGMLSKELNQESISKFIKTIEIQINAIFPFVESKDLSEKFAEYSTNLINNSLNNISNIVSGLFSVFTVLIIVPFMTFFILKDNKRLVNSLINIMPNKYFEMSYSVVQKIIDNLTKFVRGWILDAVFVGILTALGLTILGIDNAISIGFIAGVGHLIPYFGPIIGGLPALLISLLQFGDLSMLPAIIIMFTIIYAFDNGFIQPNVFSKSTDLHPLTIIILILVGSKILGVFGMLIAIPVATIIKTATREIYTGYKNYQIIKNR